MFRLCVNDKNVDHPAKFDDFRLFSCGSVLFFFTVFHSVFYLVQKLNHDLFTPVDQKKAPLINRKSKTLPFKSPGVNFHSFVAQNHEQLVEDVWQMWQQLRVWDGF